MLNFKDCLMLATLNFDRALLGLYKATKDKKYLNFCVNEWDLLSWNQPVVLGRHGKIEGHAYAFMCRCISQLELYRIVKDERLLAHTKKIIDFLTKEGGLTIIGNCGIRECWHNDQTGIGELGETCATAYLLFMLDILLKMERNSFYGDIMERIIYNALFAAQSPDGRKLRYYSPFEGERKYWDKDTY